MKLFELNSSSGFVNERNGKDACKYLIMIDKQLLINTVEDYIKDKDLFLVDVSVKPDNLIEVEIDSDNPVSIEECEKLTRAIEGEFDRDKEDYTLEVGSAGITSPFKVKRQYLKNVGKEVEVLTKDGKKLKGLLKGADDNGFVIITEEKVKPEGSKKPVMEKREHHFGYDDVKYVKYLLKF